MPVVSTSLPESTDYQTSVYMAPSLITGRKLLPKDLTGRGIVIVDTGGVHMRARVQKWGNSLALRIPRSFAAETQIQADSEVDLALEGGRLVITPVTPPAVTLEELLAGVTEENRHGEWDTGPAVGSEVW
jgi:antitoxin MazE